MGLHGLMEAATQVSQVSMYQDINKFQVFGKDISGCSSVAVR
jgi:hypothetical protein